MADLQKSVAELRALILPHLLDLEALDKLCALAAPNAKLREAARDLAYRVLSGWIKGDPRVLGCTLIPNSVHDAMLGVAVTVRELSAAPEAAKADEVAEPSDVGEFDGYAEGAKILKGCIAKYSVEQARAVGIALRQWHDKWVGAVDAIGSNAKQMQEKDAEVAELRAKLEAAEQRLTQENDQWADQIAAALRSTAHSLGRTPSMLACHVRREHEAHTRTSGRLLAVAKERDDLKTKLEAAEQAASYEATACSTALRDLAAARADQRAVAVEELRKVEKMMAITRAHWCVTNVSCDLENVRERIAALTAPAVEPAKPEPRWFEPNDHTKNVCAIRRKSDGYWWECNSEHGAGWNDKRIRQAWTIRAARIEVEKHLHGQDVEIVQLMPEPAPNPSETPNSSTAGGDGDAVLRECIKSLRLAPGKWTAEEAALDVLCRRALEGK